MVMMFGVLCLTVYCMLCWFSVVLLFGVACWAVWCIVAACLWVVFSTFDGGLTAYSWLLKGIRMIVWLWCVFLLLELCYYVCWLDVWVTCLVILLEFVGCCWMCYLLVLHLLFVFCDLLVCCVVYATGLCFVSITLRLD